jgi:hypothetical protein
MEAVYPVYAAMLQHLRSIALESFKTKLEKTVKEKRGSEFEAFGQSIMLEFEKGCEGKKKYYLFFVYFILLKLGIVLYIYTLLSIRCNYKKKG